MGWFRTKSSTVAPDQQPRSEVHVVPGEEPDDATLEKLSQVMKANTDPAYDGPFGCKGWYLYPYWNVCFRTKETPNAKTARFYFKTFVHVWMYGGFISIIGPFASQCLGFLWISRTCAYSYELATGTGRGAAECSVPDGDWGGTPYTAEKIQEWLRNYLAYGFMALQWGWWIHLMYGFKTISRRHNIMLLVIFLFNISCGVVFTAVFELPTNDLSFMIPRGTWLIVASLTMFEVRRIHGDKSIGTRWAVGGSVIYPLLNFAFFYLQLTIARGAPNGLLFFLRVVVHPIWAAIATAVCRRIVMDSGWLPGFLSFLSMQPALMVVAWYARFLLLQLAGVGDVVLINLLSLMVTLLARVSMKPGSGFASKVFYGTAVPAVSGSNAYNLIRMAESYLRLFYDVSITLMFGVYMHVPGIATEPGMPPDYRSQWTQIILQIATSIIGELFGGLLEVMFFEVDIKWFWYNTKSYFFRGQLIAGLMCLCCNWTLVLGIIGIFCPHVYKDGRGTLWNLCHRPSYV